ncbi:MAG: acetylornithine/succinylornithine family transaminase [Anaerolineales bacterium]|nr:acetylornithine/succinylornithine family transaminase [Anaerolineales bacterium]
MFDIIGTESQHNSGVYGKREIALVRGAGALVFDRDGREYIDCVGGQGSANVGHVHPAIVRAVSAQAGTLIACTEMFYNDRRAELVSRLAALTGMRRMFLSNSGAEAVETALKFARVATGRSGIVAALRSFHGRTFGALTATGNKKYHAGFEPLVPGFSHVPYNNLEKLAGAVTEQTAAVILEPVQGEGGVYPGTAEYLRGAQELCRQRGALLILDEIQTGYGRTGKLFAYQHHDLQPDILCLAKSMAGGLPMGATLLGERVGEIPIGSHGSTFGGNPVACAAALATLDVMEEQRLPERAAVLGGRLQAQLQAIESPLVREVRGLGLIAGVELKQKVAPCLAALAERGILALPAGMTVIRLLPPLVITEEQLERVVAALGEVLH